MAAAPSAIKNLFEGKEPVSGRIYATLVKKLRATLGKAAVVEDGKKTCIHLNAGKDGFAFVGVHPRKSGLLLTIKSTMAIRSPRIRKLDQASASRCYCDTLLESVDDVDAELLGWLVESHRLSTRGGAGAA